MKLQKRRSGDQYSEHLQSSESTKVSFRALGKRSKPQLLERLVVAARGQQLQGMTDISSYRRKEADCSQQAPLLSNSVQQRGDKCRGILWPDAFTKGAYLPVVLNASSR
ncbi:hypothetical protein TNCV_683531 [Trichonephila clavipes]|nr:hypothetical protein TNCV_683531 [Trichonephila clavipes]